MLVITSIALSFQFFIELRNRDIKQIKDLNYTVEALTPSFSAAVWQLNDSSIKTLLSSLTTRSEVLFAYIAYDNQFISVIENDAGISDGAAYKSEVSFDVIKRRCDASITKDFSLDRSIKNVIVPGNLFVCYSSPTLDSEFLIATFTQYIPHLLAIVLASALFVMMVVQTVVKPLSDITRSLGQGLSILELQPRMEVEREDDEIDQLINELKINTSGLLKERGITDAALMRIAEGVAITDRNFKILRANTGLKSILLGESDVLRIENLQTVIPVPLLEVIGESTEFETSDARVLEVFGTKIESMLDDLEYVFLIRDLTEKRRLLEESVQTQKLRALDTLAGGLAHDFNNLLMIINGNLELHLLSGSSNKSQSGYIKVALKAVQNGQKLTNKLLAFSRKQQFSSRFVCANEILNEVAGLVTTNVDPAINIVLKGNTTQMVYVDESFLESALLNLIVNSCDALPDGGEISLSIKDKIIKDKTYVEFSVTDNGTGISPTDIEQVCTPFFTTKEVGKGTGLGLSMVLGFAEQSDGKFEIHSELGVGTRSAILLPARMNTLDSEKRCNNSKLTYDGRNVDAINILIVDDNRQVCSVLKQQIENLGHTVAVAHSVDELTKLSDLFGKIELVICDVVLQGETAIDIHKVLKAHNVPAPLVLISGNVPKSLHESIKKLNAVEIIRKPFSIEKLKSVIKSLPRLAG